MQKILPDPLLDPLLMEAAGHRPRKPVTVETEDEIPAVVREQLVSVPELCAIAGIHEATARHHLDSGHWPGVRVGRRGVWRVPGAVVDCLLRGIDPRTLKRPSRNAVPTGAV